MKILYHANCQDGAGAALAAWMSIGDQAYEDTLEEESVEYIPVQYGKPPPEIYVEEVFILDFSYSREELMKMAIDATCITVIDHHETAKRALIDPFPDNYNGVEICSIHVVFDMERSGAVLAWEYFHDGEEAPELLRIIEDRDLWNFDMTGTKDILAAMQIYTDWRQWKIFIEDPALISNLFFIGGGINQYMRVQMENILEQKPVYSPLLDAHTVVYNIPGFMTSETLHLALERYPEIPFAASYFDLSDKRVYSLRSRKDGDVNVADIAEKFGGGGHFAAAGFVVNREDLYDE